MSRKKILVIDDSESFLETIREILVLADLDVVTAGNGRDGIEKIYADAPDLVLLDCTMPDMDGYAVVKAMREDPLLFNKPVIMLTGKDSEYDEIKGLTLGIDDYIVKPFNPPVLIARIHAILERKARNTSANPLTLLAGNTVIRIEAEKRIAAGTPFAMLYIDLNSFKAFNDTYGFQRGDEVIQHTANILIHAVRDHGQKDDFIGHIGGDDFVILTNPDRFRPIAENVITQFDDSIGGFYDPDDRERGYIVSTDRHNNNQQFPIMTVSIAAISTAQTRVMHYGQLSEIAAELKKLAKQQTHSAYAVDRRTE